MNTKKRKEEPTMDEKKELVTGELVFEDQVIKKITAIALDKVTGLLTIDGGFFSNITEKIVSNKNSTSGINVEVGKSQVAVDVKVEVEYGKDIHTMYEELKKLVSKEVRSMTGLQVIEVNVTVVDIKSKEEYEKAAKTVKDRVDQATQSSQEFLSTQTSKVKNTFDTTELPRVE
ncbi:Asp23/Gls24 family envelope stress response protein (plasmid) [Carnobacterium maltaromaticum]|uniref:Asp23/Gls24 family envelope stress response protein n=1 Tax=Carnobacterium maltaromaticum TaxID=2751 RepID=UPI003B98761A